jgi:hypothetical protein
MEHYSLCQPAPALAVPAGMQVILARASWIAGAWTAAHEVLPVVAIQPTVVHHYSHAKVAPVHPIPSLMEKHGWDFQRIETRYAPVFITAEGKLAVADPDDPSWLLVPPGVPNERIEVLAETLKAQEIARQEAEWRIEQQDEAADEVEED